MNKEYARCCDVTKGANIIFIMEDGHDFFIEGCRIPVEFCPWCKSLLDLNLLED